MAELTTAFFVLDVLEDFSVTGQIVLDPLWTATLVAGAVFFAVMWGLKKAGRLRS